ncbi:MAG: phosphatase PAP2 family protein [Chthoniobacterales bacterium]
MTAADPSPRAIDRWVPAGILLALLLVSFLFDIGVDRWVADHRVSFWELAARFCSRFFAWHWLMLGAVAGLLIAWRTGRRDWMRVLCVMVVAASIAGLSADILRGGSGRTRPSARAPQGWYGVRSGSEWLIVKHDYNSFPSGHTTAATGFSLPLFFWRRRFAWVVFPFIAAVASSRIYLGAHHFSDTIAATLLGFLIASWIWQRSAGGERFVRALWRERA